MIIVMMINKSDNDEYDKYDDDDDDDDDDDEYDKYDDDKDKDNDGDNDQNHRSIQRQTVKISSKSRYQDKTESLSYETRRRKL